MEFKWDKLLGDIKKIRRMNSNLIACMYCLLCIRKKSLELNKKINVEFKNIKELKDFYVKNEEVFGKRVVDAILNLLIEEIDEKTLYMIMKFFLHDENLQSIEEIKQFCDKLLQPYFYKLNFSEHTTPKWLNDFAIKLLSPINGTFYDGVCGFGDTSLHSYRFSLENKGKLSVYTHEISDYISNIYIVRTFLNEMENINHVLGNMIEWSKLKENQEKFDYSIMFPPMLKVKEGIEWDFVFAQINLLNDKGKGIISISNGALFNSAGRGNREAIINLGVIEAIISFPAHSLSDSAVPFNLIIINKNKKRNDAILMVDAKYLMATNTASSNKKRFVLNDENLEELVTICLTKGENYEMVRTVAISNLEKYNLLPAQYIKDFTVESEEMGKVYIDENILEETKKNGWVNLGELADISVGMNHINFTEKHKDGKIRIVKLSDIQGGVLNKDTIECFSFKDKEIRNIEKYRVKKGDILISSKGPTVKICMINEELENTYMSASFIRLRMFNEDVLPLYLKYYLESPLGQFFIQNVQKGSSIKMINAADVKNIPFYLFSNDKQIKVVKEFCAENDKILAEIHLLQLRDKANKELLYKNMGITQYIKK